MAQDPRPRRRGPVDLADHHRPYPAPPCPATRRDLRLPWERPAPPGRLTPARVRRGFRNIRAAAAQPAGAPKPGKPGPGRPPGSKNRHPASRHDVGKNHQKRTHAHGTTRTRRLKNKAQPGRGSLSKIFNSPEVLDRCAMMNPFLAVEPSRRKPPDQLFSSAPRSDDSTHDQQTWLNLHGLRRAPLQPGTKLAFWEKGGCRSRTAGGPQFSICSPTRYGRAAFRPVSWSSGCLSASRGSTAT